MKFPASLKLSLTLHLIAVGTLPILLLGIFSTQYIEHKNLETVSRLLNTHALNVSHEATELLQPTNETLAMVKKTLSSGLLHNDAEINQYLQMATKQAQFIESIYLLDKDHRITHLGLSENNSGTSEDLLGIDLSLHDIFKQQPQLSGPVWSDTFLSRTTVEPSVTLGIPVGNGTLLGTVSLQDISTELVKHLQSVGFDFHFSLVDHHGVLIADSRPGIISQRLSLREHPEVRNALDRQVESSSHRHEDGTLIESVRLIQDTGWVAYVSLPMQEIRQSVAPLRYLLLTALFFAVLLGAILSLWLSRRMLRPILLLRDVAGEVAKGDYDQTLRPAPYEELENLSRSFRGMMDAVKTREQSILESETRFRTVFQTNPETILITRLGDGRIIKVNDACLSALGYAQEEIIEKTTLEINLWVGLAERDRYLDLINKQGFVENFEMSLRTKGGRVLIGLTSARTLVLNDETCLLAVVRNITQMKEAEARLVRSEARFRSLISVMGEGLIIIGYNGEIVQCNQAAEKILKMKAEDIIGKLHDELNPDAVSEDGTPYESNQHPAALTLQTGKPVDNQVMGIPQIDGQTIWLQINSHTLGLDQDGKPVAVVVSFADVTRLKSIATDLRESEKQMQTLSRQFQGVLEAIPDRIMILDKDMRVIWLNWIGDDLADPSSRGKVKDVCCYELPGVYCGPLGAPISPLCDKCPVKKSFETSRITSEQVELSDGRTLSLRAFPVFNEFGEVTNVIGLAQDISESLQRQAQVMRTGQLAALGELAAGVAHEINNPINGVINYAQLILNKSVAGSREENLSQRIIKESERVATIVRELLYFARDESMEVDLTTVETALNEAFALIQNQIKKHGVTLQVQLPADLPMINSHSHQIQRLFLNLISNASYALAEKHPDMDPDKILKIVGEEVLKNNQTFVRITFRDEGVGIDADVLPRVMNPFVTTKPSSIGTGLGLSISYEIVQNHGGTISIASAHGEYTEVVVELPAVKISPSVNSFDS